MMFKSWWRTLCVLDCSPISEVRRPWCLPKRRWETFHGKDRGAQASDTWPCMIVAITTTLIPSIPGGAFTQAGIGRARLMGRGA